MYYSTFLTSEERTTSLYFGVPNLLSSTMFTPMQNGHSTNSMCNFLCSSLAAVLQDYGVNQQSFEKETSSAQVWKDD